MVTKRREQTAPLCVVEGADRNRPIASIITSHIVFFCWIFNFIHLSYIFSLSFSLSLALSFLVFYNSMRNPRWHELWSQAKTRWTQRDVFFVIFQLCNDCVFKFQSTNKIDDNLWAINCSQNRTRIKLPSTISVCLVNAYNFNYHFSSSCAFLLFFSVFSRLGNEPVVIIDVTLLSRNDPFYVVFYRNCNLISWEIIISFIWDADLFTRSPLFQNAGHADTSAANFMRTFILISSNK